MSSAELPFKHNIVHGVVFPPGTITQQRMDEMKDLPLRPDDLLIVTYPKSGTTWVQQIVKLIANDGKEDGKTIDEAIPFLEALCAGPEHYVRDRVKVSEMPSPRYFKSHTPYHLMPGGLPHTTPAKYVYIARNPKDVAVSLFYHLRGFKSHEFTGTWDEFLPHFVNGKVMFGLWFDHVLEWWKHRDSDNILFLKYEDLKKDLQKAISTIAEFMGYKLKPEVISHIEELASFSNMQSNRATNYSWWDNLRNPEEAPFMRKGTIGDWRNHFTSDQVSSFDAMYEVKMKGSGLVFDFE